MGSFGKARVAAGDPADLGSWAPPSVMATDYKGYAVHAAMLHTGKVLMWGQQGAPRGTATSALARTKAPRLARRCAPGAPALGWRHALPPPPCAHLGARNLPVIEHVLALAHGLFGRAGLMPVCEGRRKEEPSGDGQEPRQATGVRASHPSSFAS